MDEQAVELVLGEAEAATIEGVVIGILAGFAADGAPEVLFSGNPLGQPVRARTTAALLPADQGAEVALLCENGEPTAPIIMGKLQKPAAVAVDHEVLELQAEREVVIRCGKASITLTRAGKILIRGTYVFSRSSGVNKIKGGSVQLN